MVMIFGRVVTLARGILRKGEREASGMLVMVYILLWLVTQVSPLLETFILYSVYYTVYK